LLSVPGSLFIDVFIRQYYTADSNGMLPGLLTEFSVAETAVGNSSGAAYYSKMALTIADAMNSMWVLAWVDARGVDGGIGTVAHDGCTREVERGERHVMVGGGWQ
jgi:hypothetical protein